MLVMLLDGGGLYVPPPLESYELEKGCISLFGCDFLHAGMAYAEDNVRAFAYVTTNEFAEKLHSFNVTDTARGREYIRCLQNKKA